MLNLEKVFTMTAKVETYNLSAQVPHQEEVEGGDDVG
jgi:hypothetical protein